MKKTNTKGFTLIELVITMTIVVILSLISWPIYRSYHLKEVSMLGEGYALLGAIKDAQIHYYNEYGNFLSGHESYTSNTETAWVYTSADPVLGINVMNNRYFSMFNYDPTSWGRKYWQYEFIARVFGNLGNNKTVTMIMPFNLTSRQELTVIGQGTTTIQNWSN